MKSLSDNGKNMTIIAITGSYGKTSTKEYLTDILSSKFKVLSTKEHQNAEIGIAGSILNNLKPEHDIFIVEMGAYDKGKIKEICDFVKPDIGIVTGVNEQHLSLFGSMDNLLSGEGGRELLDCLPKDGLLVVNGENDYCMDLYKKAKIKKISYTVDSNIIKNVKIKTDSVFFAIGNIPFDVNILGRHNLLNFLGAVTVARELGMSFEEIAKASRKINTKNSSFKVWKSEDGFNMIDSTYSANPDGVFADLEYLKLFPGKKVIVMPCLIELGRASKGAHERIGKKIAEICDLAIITSEEFFAEIKNGAASKKMAGEKILFMADTNLIVGKLRSFCRENDSILLEGRISKNIADSLK
jgi:UDP-N-acetylmuramoyl-tripeptide--D-alanyl-D-alanine ligase